MNTIIQLIEIAATCIAAYYAASLVQMALHVGLGHDRRGGVMFRAHLGIHHANYSRAYTRKDYADEDERLSAYYFTAVIVFSVLAFWLMPVVLAVTALAALTLSYAAHVLIHMQYHLDEPVLKRFAWFRRRQRLHYLHHEQPNRNFGVLEFVWDRMLGTYTEESLASRRAK